MTTDSSSNAKQATQQAEMTKGRPLVWVRFLLIVAAVLAADLVLKYWSFDHVANTPIMVRTAEEGGPEVLTPTAEDGEWEVVSRVGPMGEPPRIPQHEPIVVVPSLLHFQLTLNTGAVFGIGQGGRPFFIAVSAIAVLVVLFYLYRSPPKAWLFHAGLACILGGALGNLYDRIRFSAVRDMLHMLPDTGLWPWIFNIADVVLIVGVVLTMLVSITADRRAAKAEKAQAAA